MHDTSPLEIGELLLHFDRSSSMWSLWTYTSVSFAGSHLVLVATSTGSADPRSPVVIRYGEAELAQLVELYTFTRLNPHFSIYSCV